MKKNNTFILISLLFLLPSLQVSATTFTAVANTDWSLGSTWDQSGAVPGPTDNVVINGFEVTVTTTVSVNSISITNATVSAYTALVIQGNGNLSVAGNVDVLATNIWEHVDFKVRGTATVNVYGNVTFTRSADNSTTRMMQFYLLQDSETHIYGDFTYDYKSASSSEWNYDIFMQNKASLKVTGKTTLSLSKGKDLDFIMEDSASVILNDSLFLLLEGGEETAITVRDNAELYLDGTASLSNSDGSNHCKLKTGSPGGRIDITGDVIINSLASNMDVLLESDGTDSEFKVRGDIILEAVSDQDAEVLVRNSGSFYLGGNIARDSDYGYLNMSNGGQFILNGTGDQNMTESNLTNSGADDFNFSDLIIDKPNGSKLILQGDVTVSEDLSLNGGIIESSSSALLIIEDGATITGGSAQSYVDGPIVKRGSTNGNPFVFPTGHEGMYAPITISSLSLATTEYVGQFFKDPPPFGNLTEGIAEVSNKQYWELEKTAGLEDVEITLHWMDPDFEGLTDLSKLLVVGLDPVTENWKNFGKGSTDGSTISETPGSVTSNMGAGDPPPFGTIKFTIGSDTPGSLPVELLRFNAVQDNDEVYLEWATVSEINFSHFVVERSLDGIEYKNITQVSSIGDSEHQNVYATKDWSPYYGTNFYRLKMVDRDGSFEYSNIEVVRFEVAPVLLIYPNPVRDMLQLQGVDLIDNKARLEVFTSEGQLLFKGDVVFNNGTLMITADEVNIRRTGAYMIRVTIGDNIQNIKLMKVE